MRRNYLQELTTMGAVRLIVYILLAVSVQNTWAFIRTPEFVPNQDLSYSVMLLLLYEGGALLWLHVATKASDNPVRYLIAWLMAGVSFGAVAIAMFYEMNSGILFFNHGLFVHYAPVVTSNTLFLDLIMGMIYLTFNRETHAHHQAVKYGGHFGELREEHAPVQPLLATRVSPVAAPAHKPKNTTTLTRLGAAWSAFVGHSDNKPLITQKSSANEPLASPYDDDEYEQYDEDEEEDEDEREVVQLHTSSRVAAPRDRAVQRPQRTKYRTYEQSKEALALFTEKEPRITDARLVEKVGCSMATVRRWRKEEGSTT